MPIGLNIDNPQYSIPTTTVAPQIGGATINYGGNVLGGGSTSSSAAGSTGISTILLYGIIALVVIFILQRLGDL
jgi:hypothetical protein